MMVPTTNERIDASTDGATVIEVEQPSATEVAEFIAQMLASGKTPEETFNELIAAGVDPSLARSGMDSVVAQQSPGEIPRETERLPANALRSA